jgi:MFS family permease
MSLCASDTVRTNYRITFVVLAAGAGSFALLQSMIIPVLTTIQLGLHSSQNAITWVLTGYLLSASICTPIVGRIGDLVGKRRMLVVTLGMLALGSLLAALATSIQVMILARVIQGAGGGVLPLSFGIVRDEFPDDRVPGAIGAVAALTSAGSGIGIAISGPIVTVLDYRWLFWLPMILTVVTAVAAYLVIPESQVRSAGRVGWAPAVLLAVALAALLLGVSKAPVSGWGSLPVLGLLACAAVFTASWIWTEVHVRHPLIDMRMMRLPTVWTVNLVALLMGSGMYAAFAFAPEFIQAPASTGYGFGASITASGLLLLPQAIAGFAFGVSSGWLTRMFSARQVLITSLVTATAAFVALGAAHDHVWEVVAALTLLGCGFGAAYAGMAGLVVDAVPAEQTGVATGMNANIRTIGGAIGSAAVSSMITAQLAADGLPLESGYTHAFLLLAVVMAAGVVAALLVPRSRGGVGPGLLSMPHAELGLVAGGTLAGADPE